MYPPQRVADPVQAGILDHGRTASLIVDVPDKGMIRYAYGDWNWYALGRTGPAEGSAALLWPSQAALGRMELPGPFSPTTVSREVRVVIEDALYLTVDARDVRRLVDRLDRIFDENRAESVYNETHHLVFVPYPEPYSTFHNSNHLVAAWLEQLGCRVEGPALLSSWKLGAERPDDASAEVSAGSVDRAVGAARSRGSDTPARRQMPDSHSVRATARARQRPTASIRRPGTTRLPPFPQTVITRASPSPWRGARAADPL